MVLVLLYDVSCFFTNELRADGVGRGRERRDPWLCLVSGLREVGKGKSEGNLFSWCFLRANITLEI